MFLSPDICFLRCPGSYGLESKFRNDLYSDFEEETLRDYKDNNLYGLEKFWAFHFYRKSEAKIEIRKELQQVLVNFRTLEDFTKAKDVINKAKKAEEAAAAPK